MTTSSPSERLGPHRANVERTEGERFAGDPERVLVLGTVFLALFALAALWVPDDPIGLEQRWSAWMHQLEGPLLTDVALVLNFLGRGIGRAALLVAPAIILLVARRWWALLAFAVTEAVTPLISSVTKVLVGRARPPDELVHPAGASFPSGHASFAAATAVAFVFLFTETGPRRSLWWTIAAAATASMAWSRTYLQVHWLLDVCAGALLGGGIALVVFAVVQRRGLSVRSRRPRMRRTAAATRRRSS